jgi:hypothetical protein
MHSIAIPSRRGARLVIRMALARTRLARLQPTWQRVEPWLAALALVFGYLFLQQWIATMDLRDTLRMTNAANIELDTENARLEEELAEAKAAHGQKLFYLIEADSTHEAKDKLARASMLVAGAHFQLQEAGK